MTNRKSSVLFVSSTARNDRPFLDISTRYRCFHMADALSQRGYRCQVISQQRLQGAPEIADSFDRLVFHRPQLTDQIAERLLRWTETKRAVADFDDLIFDVKNADNTSMVRKNPSASKTVRNFVAANAGATGMFSLATYSTTPLKKRADELFSSSNNAVVHNALDRAQIGMSRLVRQHAGTSKRRYRLGYFSGTATHNADFAMIAEPLARALTANPRDRLLIVGPLDLPAPLGGFLDRIERLDFVPFVRLPALMAQVDTVLAPLEESPFNSCKSGLKFFEAALVGCRVVATPIPDIDRFESILLKKCKSEFEWDAALTASCDIEHTTRFAEARRIERLISMDPQVDSFCSHIGLH